MRRKSPENLRRLRRAFARVVLSLFCASVFYFIWMGAFILSARLESSVVEVVIWLLAPVVTATGFAAGIVIFDRLTGTSETGFLSLFVWPLIGCAIGAGIVFWFGPMLIVFGMFAAGTAGVVLREIALSTRNGKD
jgi:hypothetical protein